MSSHENSAVLDLPHTQGQNLMTLQSFTLDEERTNPHTHGFSWIISALSISAKIISSKIRRARLEDVLGDLDSDNVQGERQQKLDVLSNEILIRCLGNRSGVAIVASEENEEPIYLRPEPSDELRYSVLFDPLDGSSNLDVCGGVGTIFSLLEHDPSAADAESSVLQPGIRQVAAGYIIYGSSTIFVMTVGSGVHMFVLDPSVGAFMLVQANVMIPTTGKIYSVNEGNRLGFPEGYQNYLDWAQKNGYSARYAGAMVADVHRTLLKGGVFFYPPTASAPNGKLRLMYEANPMAMLIEQAGGKACAGTQRIMEIEPDTLHQRTSVVLGSSDEVDHLLSHLK